LNLTDREEPHMRRVAYHVCALVLAAMTGLVTAAPAAANGERDPVLCRPHAVAVALATGQPAGYTVSGELCATRAERYHGGTVQLLVHGATYDHRYWDFAAGYSYARDVAARGIATFALDAIGAGRSSHPASDQVTFPAAVHVLHQVVQALRSGAATGVRFAKVITVGHSLGSVVVVQEAAAHRDVDGVIVTGAAHSLTTAFAEASLTAFYPAVLDPRFAGSGLDPGYLTTVPGRRTAMFYTAPDFDPAVAAADEASKDVISAAELGGIPPIDSPASRDIRVPVLVILGSEDFTTCGPNPLGQVFDCSSGAAVVAQEQPFYAPEAHLRACVVPASGHDVSLARDHGYQVAYAVAWSAAYVTGPHDAARLPYLCG
jgi:alpha-beta hydrolase superfamily lysophospholipase